MKSNGDLGFVEKLVLGQVFKRAATGGFGPTVAKVYESVKGLKLLIGSGLGLVAAAASFYGAPPEVVTAIATFGAIIALGLGIPDKGTWMNPQLTPETAKALSVLASVLTYAQWGILVAGRAAALFGWNAVVLDSYTEFAVLALSSLTGFLASYADPVAQADVEAKMAAAK